MTDFCNVAVAEGPLSELVMAVTVACDPRLGSDARRRRKSGGTLIRIPIKSNILRVIRGQRAAAVTRTCTEVGLP